MAPFEAVAAPTVPILVETDAGRVLICVTATPLLVETEVKVAAVSARRISRLIIQKCSHSEPGSVNRNVVRDVATVPESVLGNEDLVNVEPPIWEDGLVTMELESSPLLGT